jgi:hypothetical protein
VKLKILLNSLLLTAFAMILNPATAGELLIGAKIGVIDPEFDTIDESDPFAAVTVGVGYEFLDLVAADIAAELEFTGSLSESSLGNSDYDYKNTALIFSLRTAGPVYFIGRAGAMKQEFDFTENIPPEEYFSHEDNATVLGAGIGFSTGLRWEIQLDAHKYQNKDNTPNNDGTAYFLNIGLSF